MDQKQPLLVFETVVGRRATGRIWEYEDGRIQFQCLKPGGQDTTIFCSSLEEARSLWDRMASRMAGVEIGAQTEASGRAKARGTGRCQTGGGL